MSILHSNFFPCKGFIKNWKETAAIHGKNRNNHKTQRIAPVEFGRSLQLKMAIILTRDVQK
jgi:hypothetical protein